MTASMPWAISARWKAAKRSRRSPAIPAIWRYVGAGCAHISTSPYIVIDGDRAVATCHTMVNMHGENGFFIGRLSASRIELARQADGGWKITYRQNYMLDGDPAGSALLGRLKEGPSGLIREAGVVRHPASLPCPIPNSGS